jgi:N-acetylmuramoyl-L-alanine amidase CwlA
MQINIVKKTSTHNTTSRPNRNLKYIVIHYTAGLHSRPGAAANIAQYFATTTVQASSDFIVDDATIVQYNPDIRNRNTWHCGGGKQSSYGAAYYQKCTNSNSIGIEVCSSNYTGRVTNANDKNWYYTDAVIEQTILLTKYLMETYNIDADHVIRHFDVTGKLCPGIIGWNAVTGDESKWHAFKARLTGGTVIQPAEVNYKGEVTASSLNCRSGSSTSYPVVTTYAQGTVVTITKEQNGWGYTGAGWVSLSYIKKITETPKPVVPNIVEEEEEMTQEKFNEMMDAWIAEQAKKDASDWSAESREWAEKNGLISGDTDGKKMYKKMLTREELVTVLYRALHRHFI